MILWDDGTDKMKNATFLDYVPKSWAQLDWVSFREAIVYFQEIIFCEIIPLRIFDPKMNTSQKVDGGVMSQNPWRLSQLAEVKIIQQMKFKTLL